MSTDNVLSLLFSCIPRVIPMLQYNRLGSNNNHLLRDNLKEHFRTLSENKNVSS